MAKQYRIQNKHLKLVLVSTLILTGSVAFYFIVNQQKNNSETPKESRTNLSCREIVMTSSTPTPYDRNNPYSHEVIRNGVYIDYIQRYCFTFPEDEFITIDGWLTSPKSITEDHGVKVFNFIKLYLTISSSATNIDNINYEEEMRKVENIRLPVGSITERDNLEKIEEKFTKDFERATFYSKTLNGEYYDSVAYTTVWYLPAINRIAEFTLYAHADYEQDLEAFKNSYDNIINSFEFF